MRRTILVLLLLGLVATGCAGAPNASTGTAGTAVDRSATLTVGNIAPPTSFDPHRASSSKSDPAYLQMAYDQLFRIDADWKLKNVLTESYEFTPDGRSITLHLRQGVRFVDGGALDANAVAANLERARSLPGSTAAPHLKTVGAITALDPASVRIDFTQPELTFPIMLATNPNVSSIISPAALGNADLDRRPVGSAPTCWSPRDWTARSSPATTGTGGPRTTRPPGCRSSPSPTTTRGSAPCRAGR